VVFNKAQVGNCCQLFAHSRTEFTSPYHSRRFTKYPTMISAKIVIALIVAMQLAVMVDSMGLCFGGYPACCQGGKNTCGPFCASCSRVGEFLMNMMMFDPRGFGKGTPNVFRLINPDPHAFPEKNPFPAKPFPTNNRP